MDETSLLSKEAKKEPSLTLRKCEVCGTMHNVYFCTFHQHNFCRYCLIKTKQVGTSTLFVAKCGGLGNCEFIPMGISGV